MSSVSDSSVLFWIKVNKCCGNKMRVVIKVHGEEIDNNSNCVEKVFYWMGHGKLLCGARKL